MGTGANFGWNKGMVAEGTTAYAYGEAVVRGTAVQSVARATTANKHIFGVVAEAVDASKLTENPGKVVINIQSFGFANVMVGGAVAKGDPLVVNANARFIKQATAGGPVSCYAEEAATADGQIITAMLTPGATL